MRFIRLLAVLCLLLATSVPAQTVYIPDLTGPTGATGPAGADGVYPLLATYTPSAAASVEIDGVFDAAYSDYIVTFNLLPATDNVEFWIRTDSGGDASWDAGASDYSFTGIIITSAPVTSALSGTAESSIRMAVSGGTARVGNAAGEGIFGYFRIPRMGSGTQNPQLLISLGYKTSLGDLNKIEMVGSRNAAAALTGVQLLFGSGNIASGTVRVHGVPAS